MNDRLMNEMNVGVTHDLKATPESTAAGTQCGGCRSVHLPARWHRCLGCGSKALAPTRVELRGVFESWAPSHSVEPEMGEWALGLVKLDAGPMLTVRVRITGVPLYIGARVLGTTERPADGPERFWFEVLLPPEEANRALTEVAA